jgi:predicted RNA-binding protein with PUA-like domain
MAYWLLKSEPTELCIDDLAARPDGREPWDGVRNYQARNFLRDRMRVGDRALFYHSSCADPGVVGIARIASPAYPDPTQFIPGHRHQDPASDPAAPRWWLVDVQFERKLARTIPLAELKARPELAGMALLRRGNRLSVLPVTDAEWDLILSLEQGQSG